MSLCALGFAPLPSMEEGFSPAIRGRIVRPFMYTGTDPSNKLRYSHSNHGALVILRDRRSVSRVFGGPSAGLTVSVLIAIPLPLFDSPISDGSLRSMPFNPSGGYQGLVLGIEEADVLDLVPHVPPQIRMTVVAFGGASAASTETIDHPLAVSEVAHWEGGVNKCHVQSVELGPRDLLDEPRNGTVH